MNALCVFMQLLVYRFWLPVPFLITANTVLALIAFELWAG